MPSIVPSPHRREQDTAIRELLNYDPEGEHVRVGGMVFQIKQHVFEIKPIPARFEGDCEVCQRPLKVMIKASRRLQCKFCKINVHKRCHLSINRVCVASRRDDERINLESFERRICPNNGLGEQEYRCHECGADIGYNCMFPEPRLCDYTGKYYCPTCHKGQQRVIPARVVKNWDFAAYPVSQTSRDILIALHASPLINLDEENSKLFPRYDQLREVASLRKRFQGMASFLMSCREARKAGILHGLRHRQHFLQSSAHYSMQDLLSIHSKDLLEPFREIVETCEKHIRSECPSCSMKGFICEVCRDRTAILYPFDDGATACHECKSVFHKTCFQATPLCPRCVRLESRRRTNTE